MGGGTFDASPPGDPLTGVAHADLLDGRDHLNYKKLFGRAMNCAGDWNSFGQSRTSIPARICKTQTNAGDDHEHRR
ncbi:hypothetical protein [Novosphingobium aerophilum]|uniref:hypothetical protein n=1 Tax=Novosphingobium aerophilum TaxID=2839843 RepID=UPI0017BC12FD